MKTTFQVKRVVSDSIRAYFAPVFGAYKGIRSELRSTDLEIERRRNLQDQQKNALTRNR